MKRTVLCMLLLLALVTALPMAAAAENSTSKWDTVDWKTYDRNVTPNTEEWASLKNWLQKEASFAKLFEVHRDYADGAFAELLHIIIYERMMEKPEEFLIALAKEGEETQEKILFYMAGELEYAVQYVDKETTVSTLEGICLNPEQEPKAVELLASLIEQVEKKLNISITNPQTGDAVTVAAAALLLSGSGLTLGIRKKRRF